jgi:B-box zinc finger
MNCAIHPQAPAVAFCRTCGRALCAACKRDVRGVVFCEDCLASRVEAAIPQGAPPPPPVPPRPTPQVVDPNAPNPTIAAILGFLFPGVGAMYCGEFTKAVIHVLIFAALVWGTANTSLEPLFGIAIAFWIFFMGFDSYRTARAKQLGQPVPDPLGFGSWQPSRMVAFDYRKEQFPTGAVILLALGVLFLLGNMYDLSLVARLWPLILVYFGVTRVIMVQRTSVCPCMRCRMARMTGPAVLLTLGVLFSLQTLANISFNRTFPALLIVIGAVKLLQAAGSTEGHIGTNPPGEVEPPPPPAVVAGTNPETNAPHTAEEREAHHG